jgi:hypothetical protein
MATSFGSTRARAEPSASERETARGAMDEGDRLRAAGDLQAALTNYRAADEIMHVPTTGIEVARTLTQLGLLVEARSAAIDTAHLPLGASEPAVFTEARRDATALAAELEPRIPSIATQVQPKTAAYSLNIDRVELPSQARSLPFRTNPGEHVVSVKAPGFATVTKQFTLAEAERRILAIELKASPVPPVAQPALAHSSADEINDSGHAARMRGYIGLGAGGAVFLAGAVSGIVSIVQTHDLKPQCQAGCPAAARGKLDSANALANVANVAIPLGLIGIAYGVYELVTAAPAPPPLAATQRLHVEASAQGAYASWRGEL